MITIVDGLAILALNVALGAQGADILTTERLRRVETRPSRVFVEENGVMRWFQDTFGRWWGYATLLAIAAFVCGSWLLWGPLAAVSASVPLTLFSILVARRNVARIKRSLAMLHSRMEF